MLTRIPPLQISTGEAFDGVFQEDALALYITAGVYAGMEQTIRQQLHDYGYTQWMACRRGVIFVRTRGPNAYDPARHRIYLPLEGIE